MRQLLAYLTIPLTLAATTPAQATPELVGWPPPGGADYAGAGSVLHGTAIWTYSNFDPSAWGQLWWGLELIQLAMDGAIDSPGETLSLGVMSGDTAIWLGETSIDAGPVETRMVASVISGGSDWLDPASLGLSNPDLDALSEVDGTVDFVIAAAIEARFAGGLTWSPYLPFFDANTGASEDGNALSSFYRNFYATPVPLPAGLPLALAGLAALGLARRWPRGRARG